MKIERLEKKFTLLLMLFFVFTISVLAFVSANNKECRDSFLSEIYLAAEEPGRDITSVVNKYIPAGTEIDEAKDFLVSRGFKWVKTKPSDWHDQPKSGEDRYYAYKEERRNIYVNLKYTVILISSGGVVSSGYGKAHLTGL